MEKQKQEQNKKKNSFFNKYKEGVNKKLENKLNLYKESSGSWIFLNRVGGILLDLLGWIILGIVFYLGYKSGRWMNIDC